MLAGAVAFSACNDNDDDNVFLTVQHDDVKVSLKNLDKWVTEGHQIANDAEAKVAVLEQQAADNPQMQAAIELLKTKIATLRQALQQCLANPTDETFAAAMDALKDLQSTAEKIFSGLA